MISSVNDDIINYFIINIDIVIIGYIIIVTVVTANTIVLINSFNFIKIITELDSFIITNVFLIIIL